MIEFRGDYVRNKIIGSPYKETIQMCLQTTELWVPSQYGTIIKAHEIN